MNRMMLLCWLLLASVLPAGDYTWSGGYWWSQGQPYRRVEYCHNGCRSYRYEPVPYHAPHDEYDVDRQLQELRKLRLRLQIEAARSKLQSQALAEELREMQLLPGYSLSAETRTISIPLAVQGQTAYAPLLQTQSVPAVDLLRLYTMADSQVEALQQTTQQAARDFMSLVAQQSEAQQSLTAGQQEVLKMQIRLQALQMAAALVDGPPHVTESESKLNITPQEPQTTQDSSPEKATATPTAPFPKDVYGDGPVTAEKVIEHRCLTCHSGQSPKGGLDLSRWGSFSQDQRERIAQRLITGNPDQLMPKDSQGKGFYLSLPELTPFFP